MLKRCCRGVLTCAALLLAVAGARLFAAPLDLLSLAAPGLLTLSPGGQAVAFVRQTGSGWSVMLASTAQNMQTARLLVASSAPVSHLRWLNQHKLLVATRNADRVIWLSVNTRDSQSRTLLQQDVGRGQGPRLLQVGPTGDLLISNDQRRPFEPDLYRLGSGGGKPRREEINSGKIFRWLVSGGGPVRVARRWSGSDSGPRYEWLWRPAARRTWRTVAAHRLDEPAIEFLGWSADGRHLYLARQSGPVPQVEKLDISSGVLTPVDSRLWPGGYLRELTFAPDGRLAMVGAEAQLPLLKPLLATFQSDYERLQAHLAAPALRARWLGQAPRGRLWSAQTDTLAQGYFIVGEGDPEEFGQWAPEQAAPMQAVRIASGELMLPAYLTRPANRPRGLVLLIHGGPWHRDYWGWSDEVQLLAAAGYAVLQVNFRGSGGLGHDWLWQGRRGWGSTIMQDLGAAIRWAQTEDLSGGGPICAMGSSFGGYAALMLLADQDSAIDCAIARAPVSDLIGQMRHIQASGNQRGAAEWRLMVGDPATQVAQLRRWSPINASDSLRRPLLLAHGSADRVVPLSQSLALLQRMRRSGAAPRWLTLEGQDHDLTAPEQRLRWYCAVIDFLRDQDAGGAAPRSGQ